MATYADIASYVKLHHGFTVKTCWIAHVKEMCGLKPRQASSRLKPGVRMHPCPEDKRPMIEEAFKALGA